MRKHLKKRGVIITTSGPIARIMLFGQTLTQTGKVTCGPENAVNNLTLNEMILAQADLDRQSSESIMQLVDHIDDVLLMWFGNPIVARNNLKHIADCLDEISQAFSEKSQHLYGCAYLSSSQNEKDE